MSVLDGVGHELRALFVDAVSTATVGQYALWVKFGSHAMCEASVHVQNSY
jgi:hypothetical protein